MLDDERVAALNRIAELHDDAVVNASVAADFLGMHRKTLARLRRDGIAPPAIQYPERKTKSRNQALYFVMRDLRSYRDTNKTQSPIAAAKARGHEGLPLPRLPTCSAKSRSGSNPGLTARGCFPMRLR